METSYSFHFLDKAVFSSYENKDLQAKLRKWGFVPHMTFHKFRFDQPFNEFSPSAFLLDLANSPEVAAILNSFRSGKKVENISEINYVELKCSQTSMDYFNFLYENDLVHQSGSIRKVIPEYVEEIEICDKIREALLVEESEEYLIFDSTYRNEFLFRIFQHVTIGGGMCQYEDEVTDYLEVIKGLYKDLVAVTKDNESGELKVQSKVFQILAGEQFAVFNNPHIQDFCYAIIDPSYRHVNIWQHKFTGLW